MSTLTSVHLLYFRVKELKRNHSHKGRKSYTAPQAKHNVSSKKNCRDSSSFAPQVKNLLNIPNGPSKILDPGVPVLCSTPKKSGEEKDAFASTRQGKRPGQFMRIRELQRKCVKGEKKASGKEAREKYGGNKAKDANHDEINTTGMVFGKATTKNSDVPILEKNSESRYREKENQQLTFTEDNKDGCEGHREFVKIRSGFCAEEGVLSQRSLQSLHEKDKERKQRLRQYHQQLQQCWPLSASSSHVSLSEQTSHPPLSSSFLQDYNISAPDLMDTDLEKELSRLSAWMGWNNELLMPPQGGVFDVTTETWQRGQDNEAEVGAGDLSVSSKEGTVREEESVETGYGNLSKTQEQKSKQGYCSAGEEREGGRRLAWTASSDVAQMEVGTEVWKNDANRFGNNCDCIQKEEIDCMSTMSSGCISEPLSILLFQTSQRIDPSSLREEKQNNFQLHPLENGKGGRKDNKGLSILSRQAKGLGFTDKSEASHSAANCSETKRSSRNTTMLRLPHQSKDDAQQNSKPQLESLSRPATMTQQHLRHLKQASQSKLSPRLKTVAKSSLGDAQIAPTIHLCTGEDLHHAQ